MKSTNLFLGHYGMRKCTGLWLLWLALVATASAQLIPTGSIVGTVKDPQGAVVPHVTITVTNVNTGIFRSTTSNAAGQYLLVDVLPGVYRVGAVLQGFKKFEQQQALVEEGKSTTVDISLQLGSTTQTVQVVAPAPLLQTTTASLTNVVNNQEVRDLPLMGRNTMMLEYLSAGVVDTHSTSGASASGYGVSSPVNTSGRSEVSYFSANGGGWRTNEYTLDGVPNGSTDSVLYLPPPDQILEFNVMTTAVDAQYGHGSGAQVVLVTKSGTNKLHGDAYEFLQNSVFNATAFFTNLSHLPKPSSRLNQFGGAIGGPIKQNKTFFFFNYEGIRTSAPSTVISTVPTALQRQGNFSQTFNAQDQLIQIYNPFTTAPDPNNPGQYIRQQFPGNIITPSTLINSASSGLLALVPLPNQPGAQYTGANNYVNIQHKTQPFNNYSGRIDHEINENNRFFGRYSFEKTDVITTNAFATLPASVSPTSETSTGVGYTAVLSPDTVLDVALGWSGIWGEAYSPHANLANYGFSSSYVNLRPEPYIPAISITDMTGFGFGVSSLSHQPNWGFNANMRHMQGRQSLKWGFQTIITGYNSGNYGTSDNFYFNRGFTQGPNPNTVGSSIGYGVASYLLGTMLNTTVSTSPSNYADTSPYYGFYFQDDIRATPKLTVNLGVRWEVWEPATERFNRNNAGWAFGIPNPIQAQAQANYAAMEPASIQALLPANQFQVLGGLLFATPANRHYGKTYLDGWEPRIGFAYRVTPKTVVRGGFGTFRGQFWAVFNRQNGFSTNTNAVGTVDGITPVNLFNNPYPNGLTPPSGASLGQETLLGQSLSFLYQYSQPDTYTRWNFGVQRQLANNLMFEAYYVGATDFHVPIGSAGQIFSTGGNSEQDFILDYLPAKYLSLGSALNNLVPNPFQGLIPSGSESGATISEGQLLSLYPEFTSVDDSRDSDGRSYYNALQATVTKNYSHGLTLLSSYTWSKQMDRYRYINASDPGPSDMIGYFDAPQRFTLGGVYELPFGPGRSWGWKSGAGGKMIGGWQLSVTQITQSGMPIQLNSALILTGQDPTLPSGQRSRLDWFNKAAMIPLPSFTLRHAPWGLATLRGDRDDNWNMALVKDTSIRENIKVQFRWEVFNVLNRCQFGVPDANPSDANYGIITTQENAPRQMQMALRISF